MYILLNQDHLTFNGKHPCPNLLCNLAWIEIGPLAYTIGPCDHTTLRGLTDMELKILYRNTTGKEIPTDNRNATLQILCGLMEAIPVKPLNAQELELQASQVNESFRGFYKFVEGAKRPALIQELFNNAIKQGAITELEVAALNGDYSLITTKNNKNSIKQVSVKADKPKVKPNTPNLVRDLVFSYADKYKTNYPVKNDENFNFLKTDILNHQTELNLSPFTISIQLNEWKKSFWN